jgi:nucleoid DNA-binding protein
MTTNELIKTIAARLKITQQEARLYLRNMLAAISEGLQKGETVVMASLGSLNAAPGKPVRTYDPTAREFVRQPSKIEFFFRPYKRFKERLKEWRHS